MGDKLFLNVLAPNFNINLKFNMWNYKIAMATFLMLQCQYGFKGLNVMNEDVRVLKDTLENLNTWQSTSQKIPTSILLKNSETWELF